MNRIYSTHTNSPSFPPALRSFGGHSHPLHKATAWHSSLSYKTPEGHGTLVEKKSFTLVELLIVIGILSILIAAVVVVLNPAELLRQSRDTTRMSDLASINNAISLALTQDPSLSLGTASTVYVSLIDTTSSCINLGLATLPTGYIYHCPTSATSATQINGSGWLPINFASSSVGSLTKLPIDPQNTTSSGLYFYSYITNGSQYEVVSSFESKKYTNKEASDGGANITSYEVGTNTTLAPFVGGLVGWWKFDEGNGSVVADSSGYGTHMTKYDLVNWVSGKSGYAMQMDPTVSTGCVNQNAGVQTGALSDSIKNLPQSNFSSTFWNYLSQNNGGTRIHFPAYNVPGCGRCSLWVLRNSVRIYSSEQNFNLSFPDQSINTWHFFSFVFNKTEGKALMYVDGVLAGQSSLDSTLNYGTLDWLSFGVYERSCVDSIPGEIIDDVRIFNRALSQAEIQSIYNATK